MRYLLNKHFGNRTVFFGRIRQKKQIKVVFAESVRRNLGKQKNRGKAGCKGIGSCNKTEKPYAGKRSKTEKAFCGFFRRRLFHFTNRLQSLV